MAGYDGSVRIKTDIDSKNASAQLMSLENRIIKMADKVASLRSKMDSLKDAKIQTQEYQEVSAQIEKAEQEFNKLLEKQEQMQREGKDNGVAWERLNSKMEEVGNTIRFAKGELQDLVDTGKAFTLGSDTDEYKKLGNQLKYAENDLSALNMRHDELIKKQDKSSKGYKKLGNIAKSAFDKAGKSAKKSNGLLGMMASRFKGLALSLLIFNQISKAFNSMSNAIKEGFKNLYNSSQQFKSSVDGLKASSTTLKNAFASAFAPIVQIAIPYIQMLMDYISKLLGIVAQFNAAITGQKKYAKAVKQTEKAAKGAASASNKQLSSLDKLNNLSSQSGGGGDDGTGSMFEEVPVDTSVLDFVDNLKNRLQPVIGYANELKNDFSQGFFSGLGDFEPRLKSIKDSISSIKDSLLDIFTDSKVASSAKKLVKSISNTLGSLAGSAASIGLTIATNLVGGIAKYLEESKDRIKDYLVSMFDIWSDVNELLADFFQSFAFVFEAFASENGQQLTANIIGIFMDAFMGLSELASKCIRDILQIFIQPFVENKEAFRTALEGFLGVLSDVTGTIKDGIDATFDKLNEVYDEHFKPFFDSIASGLSDTVGKFMEFWNGSVQPLLKKWAKKFDALWKEHIQPLLNNFIELLGSVADLLKAFWENILKPIIDWIIENVLPVLLPIFDTIYNIAVDVIGGIADIISGIIDVLKGIIDFLVGVFTGNWEKAFDGLKNVVSGFSKIFKSLKTTITKIFNDIWSFIKRIINSILGGIEKMANGVVSGINTVIKAMNNLSFDIPDWVPTMGGKTFGFNIPTLKNVSIPKLATGTVVPPNREFMAILGDNKKETEVVSPLSTMKRAMKEALLELGINGTSNSSGDIIIQIDGREVFRATQKQARQYYKTTGNPAFP